MTKQSKVILIVVIVGACCVLLLPVILILLTLAIPVTQAVIRHGNETSAINALKFINTEEQSYNMMYPDRGFTCSLENLGGSAQTGHATADAAQMIPADLASGHKAGYSFAFSNCIKATIKGHDQITSYELTAVPNAVGHSGNNGFCTDENGAITFDPKGGTNCTEPLQ
jgi:type IV pilus assembly protein PilA